MQVANILQQLLDATIHKTRIKSLLPIIQAIIVSKQLRLTQLGRSLDTSGKERSGIRRVDRLLANRYYQEKAIDIYKATTQTVLGNQGRPIILVDWTGFPNSQNTTENGEYCALRASLISEGRSITLYEEAHSKKKEGNDKVHQEFLNKLKSILPKGCRPYIVTDAGFKNPWFRAVLALRWDYIGRVRGKVTYDNGNGFEPIKKLHEKASVTPKSIGSIMLAKDNQLETNCYLYKHKLKGRKKLTKTGKIDQSNVSKKAAAGYREPWVLVSSLGGFSAVSKVIKIYKFRMTIEGSFRDAKSTEFGLSLNENKTIKAARYTVWLMISTLAYLIAWIVGFAAEKAGLHYDFQANTYRHRRVLSFFYLGCQIVRKKIEIPIQLKEIQRTAWDELAWSILC
jgi:Transposase DDE domain